MLLPNPRLSVLTRPSCFLLVHVSPCPHAVVLKAGKEGQYEAEGYGQRPYDNWEVIEFDCEGQVRARGGAWLCCT